MSGKAGALARVIKKHLIEKLELFDKKAIQAITQAWIKERMLKRFHNTL